MPPSVTPLPSAAIVDPESYEQDHVHSVYELIAPHFSSTRYKPWPIVSAFLSTISPGSVGLDLGTGNGKYLALPADRPTSIWTLGIDRSRNLLQIARLAGERDIREVVQGDMLDHGWRPGVFDYAISIATIHHLATPLRRRKAVESLLRSVNPSHGRILIYVWATDQDTLSKRVVPSTDSEKAQDVLIPWVLPPSTAIRVAPAEPSVPVQRYYHLFNAGELRGLACEAAFQLKLHFGPQSECQAPMNGVEVIREGWERSNWYLELKCWQLNAHFV